MNKIPKNMYQDAIFRWNVCKGCNFNCFYCIPSFQKQAKRLMPKFDENGVQYRGCQDCYDYKPHFHPERLDIDFNKKKYETSGDKFIWAVSSGDIACMKEEWIQEILDKIREYPNRTFFMQTKDPSCFYKYDFPGNMLLGITLETNEYPHGYRPSKAPLPWHRYVSFKDLDFPRKVVIIEPIMEFRLGIFLRWLVDLNPERVYIGYNSKPKNCYLPEPSLEKTLNLIKDLKAFNIKVKTKYMKEEKNV